mgnify:CR=1 FL=1
MLRQSNSEKAVAGSRPATVELTSREQIQLEFLPPSEHLRPFVTTFYSLRCDESQIQDCLPAAVGYLTVNLSGSGTLHFADGQVDARVERSGAKAYERPKPEQPDLF